VITPEEAQEAYKKYGSKRAASKELNIPRSTFRRILGKASDVTLAKDDTLLKLRRQEKTIAALRSELKKAQDDQLTNASVKKYIIGVQEQANPPLEWTLAPSVSTKDNNIPVLLLGDLHWGEVIKPSQVFNLNEYNMTIAAHRLKKLIENTIWLLRENLTKRNYPGFVLALNGDLVAGDIHEELSETNETSIMPIVVDTYQHLRVAIKTLADEFGRLFIPCCYGNHGRTNKKPQHKNQAYKNFDWLIYVLLEQWFEDDDRITFLVSDDDEIQYEVNGHIYRQTHGAQFRGGNGFLGNIAPISRGSHKKRIASQSQNMTYDTLLLSHFHQIYWHRHFVVSGSLPGYSEYGADLNFEYEPPQMIMWLTDPVYGKVNPMEVRCEDEKEYKPIINRFEV
jgi:hypothetical protein